MPAQWLSVRIHNAGVVSSNPPRVTIKASLMRKATGKVPFIGNKLRVLSLVSAKLEIKYAPGWDLAFTLP